jgi:hypothetical protein
MYRSTDSTYPVLCMQGIGPASQSELDDVTRTFAKVFERGGPIVCISDSRRASHDPVQRKILGLWANHIKELYGSRMLAVVIVLDSALMRGALTAINWISPPLIPQPTAADIREAVALTKKFYESASVDVTMDVWVKARIWFDEGVAMGSGG